MNAAKQAIWLFFALIALACSGYYFAIPPAVTKLDAKTLSTTADTIVTHLTLRQFNAQGQLANQLQAAELRHIPHNNTHLFKSPHITIAQINQPNWDIRSQRATAINGGEQIDFIKQVVVHQNQDSHTEASTLKTSQLTYFPKQKLAKTTKAIVFERTGSVVHSQGMVVNLDQNHVQLTHAHAIYEPNHG